MRTIAVLLVVLAAGRAEAQGVDSAAMSRAVRDSVGAALEVTEAYPGLLLRATVLPDAATGAALRKVKNGHLVSIQIEERGKRLVYVIRIDEPRGRPHELLVDAKTGRVLSNRKLPRP